MTNIISDYIEGKFDVVVALRQLLFIAYNLQLDEVKQWVNSELYGYSENAKLPKYRLIDKLKLVYSGTKNGIQFDDEKIPSDYLNEAIKNKIDVTMFRVSLIEIIKCINSGNSYMRLHDDLISDVNSLIINSKPDDSIVCTQIKQVYDSTILNSILLKVENVVINVFGELNSIFPNFHEAGANKINELSDVQKKDLASKITFNFNNCDINGDSINFSNVGGDNNGLLNPIKVKIKKSNIGEGDYTSERTTEINTNIINSEKECLFKKIINFIFHRK